MADTYDANTNAADKRAKSVAGTRAPDFHNLPDLYNPPRRRFHPMLTAGIAFGIAAAGFYGAEALLPPGYKPSTFTGGYERELAAARTEGELRSRVRYDAKFKLIETAAVSWQERCRAGMQNYNNLYQAAYARANAYAQATVDVQKQYLATRYTLVQRSLEGELGAANTATTFGYIFGLFDADIGRRSMEFADAARQQALRKLDEAAKGGITISVDGWNTGLPDPSALTPASKCELPAALLASQPSSEG